jgi:fumarylacetoacetate (FAA) hydrolase family protein
MVRLLVVLTQLEPKMKYAMNVPERKITLTFDSGNSVTYSAGDFGQEILDLFLLYGMRQKVVDSAASAKARSVENGLGIEQQREVMIRETLAMLKGGDWERRGEGSGRTSYLVEAVAELYSLTLEVAAEKLKAKSEKDREALAANPKVAAKIAKLKSDAAEKRAAQLAAKVEDAEMPEL